MRNTEEITTIAGLARALGVTRRRVQVLRAEAWFPRPPWNAEGMRATIAANAKKRGGKLSRPKDGPSPEPLVIFPGHEVGSGPPTAPVVSPPSAGLSDPDPRVRARAAVEVAARAVEAAEREHRFGPKEMRALCDALSELRRTEKGFDEIAESRKELIPYADAEAACGWFVVQALQAGERLAGSLGPRLVQLAEDEAWRARATADRVREVYQIVEREWDGIRRTTAADWRERLIG